MYEAIDKIEFFGEDVRTSPKNGRTALFFHDYDCTEEGYMSIVVNQV